MIVSYQFAAARSVEIASGRWDMAIIDEAHKLRNAYRQSNKLGRIIQATLGETGKILLTATPLQSSIMELYEPLNRYLQRKDSYAFPAEHRHLSVLIIVSLSPHLPLRSSLRSR